MLFIMKILLLIAVISASSIVIAQENESFAKEFSSQTISSQNKEFAEKSEKEFQKMQEPLAKIDQQKLNLEDVYKTAGERRLRKELEFVTGKLPDIGEGEGCKDCSASILIQPQDIAEKENRHPSGGTPVTESSVTLVFVSFSMPKAALIELNDQSQKYGATLVLRGIHEDSFVATKDKILEINPKGLQLDIHPDLFKQYDIKRVPTFVLVKNGKEVSRRSGNVTLEFAHSKLMEVQ